ncbi:hypothetical protein [Nocardia sp. NPDC050793]|uniref:hypothetical protein n=1 Tax=Nocardia sp. NPDC050793 TaxID=3155159 RepID=UPI0034007E26
MRFRLSQVRALAPFSSIGQFRTGVIAWNTAVTMTDPGVPQSILTGADQSAVS